MKPMTRRQKIRWTLLVAGVVGLGFPAISLIMVALRPVPPPAEQDDRMTVEAVVVAPADYVDVIRAVGVIAAERNSAISAEINATVVRADGTEGAFVTPDEVVIALDESDLADQVRATAARLDEARLRRQLAEELSLGKTRTEDALSRGAGGGGQGAGGKEGLGAGGWGLGEEASGSRLQASGPGSHVPGPKPEARSLKPEAASLTPLPAAPDAGRTPAGGGAVFPRTELQRSFAELAAARAAVATLEAEHARLSDLLDKCQRRPPFAGYLHNRAVAVGEYVTVGRRLFSVTDLSMLKAVVGLGENAAAALRPGDEARVWADAAGRGFAGRVLGIAPAPDAGDSARRYQVEVGLLNPDDPERPFPQGPGVTPLLRAGWSCRVTLVRHERYEGRLALPPDALVERELPLVELSLPTAEWERLGGEEAVAGVAPPPPAADSPSQPGAAGPPAARTDGAALVALEPTLETAKASRHDSGREQYRTRVLSVRTIASDAGLPEAPGAASAGARTVLRLWIYERAAVPLPTRDVLAEGGAAVLAVAGRRADARVERTLFFETRSLAFLARQEAAVLDTALPGAGGWAALGRDGAPEPGAVFVCELGPVPERTGSSSDGPRTGDQGHAGEPALRVPAVWLGGTAQAGRFLLAGLERAGPPARLSARIADGPVTLAAAVDSDGDLEQPVALEDARLRWLVHAPRPAPAGRFEVDGVELAAEAVAAEGRARAGQPVFAPHLVHAVLCRRLNTRGQVVPAAELAALTERGQVRPVVLVEGLETGAWVLVSGHDRLSEGDHLRVVRAR